MYRLVGVLLIVFFLGGGMMVFGDVLPDLIWILSSHKDPGMRENAATMLGSVKGNSVVKPLIDALSDESDGVQIAAHKSLIKITRQNLPMQPELWLEWWSKSGSNIYENIVSGSQEMVKLRSYLNVAFVVMILELVFIILFIVVFSFMGGAKIKEMKDINRRAESYIADADGVSKRFEELFQEIEKRRNDLNLFFNKLRDDNQNELERFSDLTQQNVEHSLREAGRVLREKSEAELRQTLAFLKDELTSLVRKAVAEQLKQNKV